MNFDCALIKHLRVTRLEARGAYFRDVSGWEGADWYAPRASDAPDAAAAAPAPSNGALTWGRPEWFGAWEAEHRACREGVVLIDMSFMAKFLVQVRAFPDCMMIM